MILFFWGASPAVSRLEGDWKKGDYRMDFPVQ